MQLMKNAIPGLVEQLKQDETDRIILFYLIRYNELLRIVGLRKRLICLIEKQTLTPLSYVETQEMEALEKFHNWLMSINVHKEKSKL
jgi:hypothetical protein